MAEKDEKNLEFKKGAKVDANGAAAVKKQKSGNKKSIIWWLGVIVLILISITFVLPAAGVGSLFGDNSTIVFGKYNGKNIEFKYGNYFYNTYNSIVGRLGSNADFNTVYQAWQNAYTSSVIHEALDQEAKKAGIVASDEAINQAILASGVYSNADGAFDEEAYRNADQTTKNNVYNSAKQQVPAQIVFSDMASVSSSEAEKAFISSMVSTGRAFNYVAFDYHVLTDDVVSKYVAEKPEDFRTIELSVISVATQEEADALKTKLDGGADFAASVQESSIDGFKSNDGKVGPQFARLLGSYLITNAEDLAKVVSAQKGEIVGPIATTYGFSIFKVDEAAKDFDPADETSVATVKQMYAEANPEEAKSAAEAAANDFFAKVQGGNLSSAAASAGYTVQAVPATVANPANSSMLMVSFAYTDSYGLLATAAGDADFVTTLYQGAEGTVLEPKEAGNGFIVTEIGADSAIESTSSIFETYYDYLSSGAAQQDIQSSILSSDKFEDNFSATFFEKVMAR
ncbi:MAG: SurA N-terminal domain-containing protein [Spirochaetales bacterium]|nr:SurA N-terminal domain-containing protein [Spirochaetales bacterium]